MSMIGHNGAPMGDGWIARHRSVRDHWLVGHGKRVKPADPKRKHCLNKGEAWEDMLMECRYEAGTVSNGGRKMELRRGEMLGAVSWLAHRWNWTPKTVRGFLDDLENDGMIELKNPATEKGDQKGRQANVVSVCNYDVYQGCSRDERQPTGQPQGDQRATTGRPEGNIYKDNKGTREQGNKVENTSPPELVAARDCGRAVAEIGGLNGATSGIVKDLAMWISPYAPDEEFAYTQIGEAVRAYGDKAVRDGYMDLKADFADGKIRAPNVKTFFGFVRTAKERAAKRVPGPKKISRW